MTGPSAQDRRPGVGCSAPTRCGGWQLTTAAPVEARRGGRTTSRIVRPTSRPVSAAHPPPRTWSAWGYTDVASCATAATTPMAARTVMPHGNKVATTGASSGAPVRIASCAVTKRRRPSSATAALRTMKGTPRAASHSGASASAWLPLTARPATKRPSAVLSYARSVRSFARLQRGSGSLPAVDSAFVRGCTCFSLPRPCRWPTMRALGPDRRLAGSNRCARDSPAVPHSPPGLVVSGILRGCGPRTRTTRATSQGATTLSQRAQLGARCPLRFLR